MKRYRWLLLLLIILIILVTYIYRSKATLADIYFGNEPATISTMGRLEEKEGMEVLRVMTYNIHTGIGMDGVMDLERISEVINMTNPDLVGLNEVDHFLPRTGFTRQIKVLGEQTDMYAYFAPTLNLGLGKYGNGVLSHLPIKNPVVEKLPGLMKREPRGYALFQTVFQEQEIQVIVTHLGLNPVERKKQLDYLAVLIGQIEEPVILMGDLNLTPSAPAMQEFLKQTGLQVNSYEPTYSSQHPEYKIDYILTSWHWERIGEMQVLDLQYSDHLPLWGEFRLREK